MPDWLLWLLPVPVATAAAIDDGPSAFRYPRGEGTGIALPKRGTPLEVGKGRVFYIALGHTLTFFATPALAEHVLAGIQFALGDLEADLP